MLLGLPEHPCRGCGSCCGPIPVTAAEEAILRDYAKRFDERTILVLKAGRHDIKCQFRNEETKTCAVYPVRPLICRIFGLTAGAMGQQKCIYGNSANIPFHQYIDLDEPRHVMPDIIGWPDWKQEITSRKVTRRDRRQMMKEVKKD
jgi:Fe-S-cluster containining protein